MKRKFSAEPFLGYCPNNIVKFFFLYCKDGLYYSLGSLDGLENFFVLQVLQLYCNREGWKAIVVKKLYCNTIFVL